MCDVGGAAMLLVRELDDDVRAVVQQTVQPSQLALGVVTDALGDLDILALDDRPHASPPGAAARARASGVECAPGRPDAPISSIDRAVPPSPLARDGDRRHARAPPAGAHRAGGERRPGRHDVVHEQHPASGDGPDSAAGPRSRGRTRRQRSPHARRGRARTGRPSRVRARGHARAGRPRSTAATAAIRAAWS